MPTTREEKPAKPRPRRRKPDQRKVKGEKNVEVRSQSDAISAIMAPMEAVVIEAAPIEAAPIEAAAIESAPVETAEVEAAAIEVAPVAMIGETETALSGEVLPPEVHEPAPQAVGLVAITQAHSDYMRKSVVAGRFLVERLTAVRSFDEALEIHGEFAKQAYANFVAQSQKICVLYGEWAQQLFPAGGKSPTQWTRNWR
jgi:hypothetical protein